MFEYDNIDSINLIFIILNNRNYFLNIDNCRMQFGKLCNLAHFL